jgi:hypothetical protein
VNLIKKMHQICEAKISGPILSDSSPRYTCITERENDVFVNINLSQSDHFKSEPLHSELLPYSGDNWEFRVSCPEGQDTLNSSRARPTVGHLPFVSCFV